MSEIINNYRDFVILLTGWLLGFGAQLIFHYLERRKDKKSKRIQGFLKLKSALSNYELHFRDGYKIDALLASYLKRTEIAKEAEQKEVYLDMKSTYQSTYERYLDHLAKESQVENNLTSALFEAISIFKSDSFFINWTLSVNSKFISNQSCVPDYNKCTTHEQVNTELERFQEEDLIQELYKLKKISDDITSHLANKYIGK